jgi:thioredoxin
LGEKPAIIDFYATWCGPCRSIAPILEELAEEYKDQIVIYKVDTDKEQELSAVFGIRSIPTLIFVPMEGNPTILQGAMSKTNFEKAINEILLVKQEQ